MAITAVNVDVRATGLADMQFDHYRGGDQDPSVLDDKMYLDEKGGLCVPAENVLQMLYNETYMSAIRACEKTREYKAASWQAKALVFARPRMIPITRNGKQVVHKKWSKDARGRPHDPKAGLWVDDSLPRVKGGIVGGDQTKLRPTLLTPWEIEFSLQVIEKDGSVVTVERVERWLRTGGLMVGIGTHRPVYGRFDVTRFAPQNGNGARKRNRK